MYELSASLFLCATLTNEDEIADIEKAAEMHEWLCRFTVDSIYEFYHGD